MTQLSKRDLETLLRPQLGNDLIIESFTSQPLTQPGENYGSTMLALEVNILQEGAKTEKQTLSLVAKLPPPSEFLWRLFDTPITFCKELTCYTEVSDEYKIIQKEKNVPKERFLDVFPACYGARTTLSHEIGDIADKNAVLILENLKTSNYQLCDRRKGLDLKHMQLAVTQLARFHAITVALKILKPQVFQGTILKACRLQNVGLDREECEKTNESLLESIKAIPECRVYLDRIKYHLEQGSEAFLENLSPIPKGVYGTIVHMDFWVNNMMFSYDANNDPISIKFLDFQGVKYFPAARDLLFFLYTSAADGVISNHYDALLHLYYKSFITCIKDLGCDISPYTFQSFLSDIDENAPLEIDHILFMLRIICADKKDVQELGEVSNDTLVNKSNDIYDRKAKEFILDFAKRGWL